MVSREVVQNLSLDALAVWTYFQSLPDDWNIKEKHIREHFKLSRERWLKAMKELKDANLYRVERKKNDDNEFIGAIYHIYAFPQVWDSTLMENHTDIKEEDNNTEKDISTDEENGDKSPHVHKWTDEDKELAKQILEIIRLDAQSATMGKSWPEDIRKLREIDKHTHHEIASMFQFANKHPFWKSNILSPATLRKQWVRLEAEKAKYKDKPMPGETPKEARERMRAERLPEAQEVKYLNNLPF